MNHNQGPRLRYFSSLLRIHKTLKERRSSSLLRIHKMVATANNRRTYNIYLFTLFTD